MMDALDDLLPIRDKIKIIHQTGEKDFRLVKEAYQNKGFSVHVSTFIDEIVHAYQQASLVVSRAGATTLAELQVCGLPAILIPFPYATAGHQEANARALQNKMAVEMVLNHELDTDKLLNILNTLMENETKRKELGSHLNALAKPDAAKNIINEMIRLLPENE